MSTDTATDERLTTADYANVLFGGATAEADPSQQQGADEKAASKETVDKEAKDKGSKKKPSAPKKQKLDDGVDTDTKTGMLRAFGNAENWIPRDFASVAPSALVDVVAAHRARYQDFDNLGVKVLYALYTCAAVPAGFVLNVVSLVAAHAATAINEPNRFREAALGLVILGIIVGALIWSFGA